MKKKAMKFISLVMAIVMVLSMGIVAFAAEGSYTVTIKPNAYISTPDNGGSAARFQAYQIFDGNIENSSSSSSSGDFGEIGSGRLDSVTWGAGIDSFKYNDLLVALTSSTVSLSNAGITSTNGTYSGASNLGDIFKNGLQAAGYTVSGSSITHSSDSDLSNSGAAIGRVLSDLTSGGNNSKLAEQFGKIISKYLASSPQATSTWSSGNWQISNLDGGYYLIMDKETGASNGTSSSDFIMGVFGNVTVFAKAAAPALTLEIVNNDGNKYGSDFKIGDTINFKMTGTLPANFGNYDKYTYKFHTTLDAGLDVEGSAKVSAGSVDITSKVNPNGSGQSLEVSIDDLKGATFSGSNITSSSKITVEFSAKLNSNATLSDLMGNKVAAYLEYSSDPNNDAKTERTVSKQVSVYTFGMQIHKYDGTSSNEQALSGAGFVVQRNADMTYAVLSKASAGDPDRYTVAGWVNESTLKSAISGGTEISEYNWKTAGGSGIQGTQLSMGSGTYYVAVQSPANGNFKIDGLEGETYTLKEVYAPDGFDPVENITVKFDASYYGSGEGKTEGTIKTLNGTVDSDQKELVKDGALNLVSDMSVSFGVANYPGMIAPGTGGYGVYIIYGIGAALIMGAGVMLLIMRKRRA